MISIQTQKCKSNLRRQQVFTKTKDRKNSDFAWDRMPLELRPNWKRKKESAGARKKIKVVNIEETLKVLEEKEKVKVPEVVEKESDAEDNEEVSIECCSNR